MLNVSIIVAVLYTSIKSSSHQSDIAYRKVTVLGLNLRGKEIAMPYIGDNAPPPYMVKCRPLLFPHIWYNFHSFY